MRRVLPQLQTPRSINASLFSVYASFLPRTKSSGRLKFPDASKSRERRSVCQSSTTFQSNHAEGDISRVYPSLFSFRRVCELARLRRFLNERAERNRPNNNYHNARASADAHAAKRRRATTARSGAQQ